MPPLRAPQLNLDTSRHPRIEPPQLLAPGREKLAPVQTEQSQCLLLQLFPQAAQSPRQRLRQRRIDIIQALAQTIQPPVQQKPGVINSLPEQLLAPRGQAMAHVTAQRPLKRGQTIAHRLHVRHNQFRRRRWRRRSQVGREIGNREIRLVTDRRYNRHRAGRNRPRQRLIVEAPQIFERAAAPGQHNHVGPSMITKPLEASHQLLRAARPLHQRRIDTNVQTRTAPRQHIQHVLDDGPAR